MTDPWKDIRKNMALTRDSQVVKENVAGLLVDADALLEFQKEAHWLFGHEPPDDLGAYTHESRKTWIARRDAMFAALPPYLKGE